jgi:menaquinol-cytochrome c reductase iron-sulfur subunit
MEPIETTESPHSPPEPPPQRRRFLARLTIALSAVAAAVVTIPWIAIVFSPLRREDGGVWRAVALADEIPMGATIKVTFLDARPLPWAGFAAQSAAWLRRDGPNEFTAFSVYCTHVGCPVRWEEGAQLFMCPCHGGAFARDGTVAAGPPPAPLPRLEVRVRNGQVELRTLGVPVPRRQV